MINLINRILTSLFLLIILLLAIFNIYLTSFLIILILYLISCELYLLLNRILSKKKIYLYFAFLISIIYTSYFSLIIYQIFLSNNGDQKIILYFLITICIFTDTGGYFFGKIFKGKKITKISPNKTYSGMIGSYIASISGAIIIFNDFFNFKEMILIIIMVSSISQLGDLFISFLKRKAKIKDTGKLLPGHGGLLDRLDGIIFAIPFGLIIIN
tara:strand:+ start:875 stop:1513 length:639 start_codon:yes stop_codon:yes gene_type:complete